MCTPRQHKHCVYEHVDAQQHFKFPNQAEHLPTGQRHHYGGSIIAPTWRKQDRVTVGHEPSQDHRQGGSIIAPFWRSHSPHIPSCEYQDKFKSVGPATPPRGSAGLPRRSASADTNSGIEMEEMLGGYQPPKYKYAHSHAKNHTFRTKIKYRQRHNNSESKHGQRIVRNAVKRGIRSIEARGRRAKKQKEKRIWGREVARSRKTCPSRWQKPTISPPPRRGHDSPIKSKQQQLNTQHKCTKNTYNHNVLNSIITKASHIVNMSPAPAYHIQLTQQFKPGGFMSRNARKRFRTWGHNNNGMCQKDVVAHWGFRDVATTRMGFLERLNIATHNARGLNEPGKMDIIDGWAHSNKIMVLALQETKISSNCTRRSAHYVWFFCTAVKPETLQKADKLKEENKRLGVDTRHAITEHLGVGFAVHLSLVPAIANVIAFGNRLGLLHLHGVSDLYIFSAYAPQAELDTAQKDVFYNLVENKWDGVTNEHIKVLCGDFNAKIAYREDSPPEGVGPHYLKANAEGLPCRLSNSGGENRAKF